MAATPTLSAAAGVAANRALIMAEAEFRDMPTQGAQANGDEHSDPCLTLVRLTMYHVPCTTYHVPGAEAAATIAASVIGRGCSAEMSER